MYFQRLRHTACQRKSSYFALIRCVIGKLLLDLVVFQQRGDAGHLFVCFMRVSLCDTYYDGCGKMRAWYAPVRRRPGCSRDTETASAFCRLALRFEWGVINFVRLCSDCTRSLLQFCKTLALHGRW
jgi:hypothetical protein